VCGIGDSGFLEAVVEAFAFSDLERCAQPLIVWAKTKKTTHQRFIGAVAFAGPRKGAVKLEDCGLGSAADQAPREQTEPAGAGGMRGGRADHYGADYVEQTDHSIPPLLTY
jgi:hypothetical protein